MKKTLLFILLSAIVTEVFAAGNKADWRWRNNNGTEKTATWKAPLNGAITISDTKAIRLRIIFNNYAFPGGNGKIKPELQYATTTQGPFTTIGDDTPGTNNAFVFAGDNANIKHWQPTTMQLTDSVKWFVPGRVVTRYDTTGIPVQGNTLQDGDIFANQIEVEWVIKPGKYIQPGKTYYFTSNNMHSGGVDPNTQPLAILSTSNDIPHETIPDDKIINYNITRTGNQATFTFRTARSGHDHFELEYSKDAVNWRTVKTIPGGEGSNYQTVIQSTTKGTYYFRLKIFDKMGNVFLSGAVKKTI